MQIAIFCCDQPEKPGIRGQPVDIERKEKRKFWQLLHDSGEENWTDKLGWMQTSIFCRGHPEKALHFKPAGEDLEKRGGLIVAIVEQLRELGCKPRLHSNENFWSWPTQEDRYSRPITKKS